MFSFGGDLRLAFRSLRKSPGFSAIAVFAFALGIGANSAIFSVVYAVLLKPLEYADPDRLVVVEHAGPSPVAPATFLDWRQQATSFEDMAAAQAWGGALRSTDRPESIVGLRVTANLFNMLGVPPMKGRTFVDGEDSESAAPVVVISYSLWQRAFGGASDIAGRQIIVDADTYTVVGVMPPSFQFAPFWVTKAEIWAPFVFGERRTDRTGKSVRVFARLKPSVGNHAAQAEITTIMNRLARQFPESSAKETVVLTPLRERVVGKIRPMLIVLAGTAGFVLLIACANVASLMLARAIGRGRDAAVRIALGAGRWRLAGQSMAEAGLLAATGGLTGLALAYSLIRLAEAILPSGTMPRQAEIRMDWIAICFTGAVAVLTGLIAGTLPAWKATRGDVNDALKQGGRTGTDGRNTHALRSAISAVEVALAFVLLVGAGLMVRTFAHLLAIDPGFDPANLVTAELSVAGTRQAEPGLREIFYREAVDRISALPGVVSASIINHAPITGDVWGTAFRVEGRPEPLPGDMPSSVYRVALPGYFGTMRTSVVQGRDFNSGDTLDSPPVTIVNEALARKHWPGEDAIGKRILTESGGKRQAFTIVGVIRDIRQADWQADPREEIYFPLLQSAEYLAGVGRHHQFVSLVARVDRDPGANIAAIRQAIASIDPHVMMTNAVPMERAVANNMWRPRVSLLLLGAFAFVATVLALTGIYGVISQSVAQRKHEIGIRMALGAASGAVLRDCLARSLRPLCGGLAAGALLSFLVMRLMQTILFGVQAGDGVTYAGAMFLMLGAGLLAAYWPALRASRVDPSTALRHD